MGKCYQNLKEFKKAVICYKKQLQLAWFNQNIDMEMSAYDNLAIQYFYLGELERSKYYNDRMCRGKFESNFSIVKKMSQNNAKKKANQDEQNKGYFYGSITNIE